MGIALIWCLALILIKWITSKENLKKRELEFVVKTSFARHPCLYSSVIANNRTKLSKTNAPVRRGAISYDSSDQTALYIRMLGDVRVRSRAGFETERRGSHPYIDFRIFH
ncbi:hypothetical protein EK904_007428, partial [Melospiza melodia maxima]